jgi:hypothetical protein
MSTLEAWGDQMMPSVQPTFVNFANDCLEVPISHLWDAVPDESQQVHLAQWNRAWVAEFFWECAVHNWDKVAWQDAISACEDSQKLLSTYTGINPDVISKGKHRGSLSQVNSFKLRVFLGQMLPFHHIDPYAVAQIGFCDFLTHFRQFIPDEVDRLDVPKTKAAFSKSGSDGCLILSRPDAWEFALLWELLRDSAKKNLWLRFCQDYKIRARATDKRQWYADLTEPATKSAEFQSLVRSLATDACADKRRNNTGLDDEARNRLKQLSTALAELIVEVARVFTFWQESWAYSALLLADELDKLTKQPLAVP